MKSLIILLFITALASCNGTKNSSSRKKDAKTQAALAETLQQKQSEGIDFFAKGSAPASWTLEIDFDKIIRLKSLDGSDYKSTPVGAVENTANNSSSFTTKAGKGNMVITLYREACTDALTGEQYNQKTTIDVDGKRYEGCGQYLTNSQLEGKWILDKIGGKTVVASEFAKGLPELSFQLSTGKLSGHDGCNTVNGNIEVMGNRIKFSPIGSTKMACMSNKKENEFIQKISDAVASYLFTDGVLNLYLIDDSVVSFKKS